MSEEGDKKEDKKGGASFTDKLDKESLKAFSVAAKKPFSEQAQFFLNAFWEEFGDQAEVIYNVHWEQIKIADMRWRNVQYVHLYEEGNDLDFDMGLYFFEITCKFYDETKEGKEWKTKFPTSAPKMVTAIVRKKALRDSVDVNFDGRISLLEFLLYQYNASPKDLMTRHKGAPDEGEELRAARAALNEVNKQIKAYETEKKRLEDGSNLPGVKGLKMKNELAQLNAGPLAEKLRKLLITAEAAVRLAVKKGGKPVKEGEVAAPTQGSLWWLNREIEAKKAKYGAKKK